jgi:hypothetical protein
MRTNLSIQKKSIAYLAVTSAILQLCNFFFQIRAYLQLSKGFSERGECDQLGLQIMVNEQRRYGLKISIFA